MHTADSLAKQHDASEKVVLIVGMEEGTPDRDLKITSLIDKYEKKFYKLIITTHPKGISGKFVSSMCCCW